MKVGDKGIVVKDIWWMSTAAGRDGYWTHEDQQTTPDIAFPNNQFVVTKVEEHSDFNSIDNYKSSIYITLGGRNHWYFSNEDAEKYLSVNKADRARNTLRRLR